MNAPTRTLKRPWMLTDQEREIIEMGLDGTITLDTMFDALPGRSVEQIRRNYAAVGDPDEQEKHARRAVIGSKGLERALKRYVATKQ